MTLGQQLVGIFYIIVAMFIVLCFLKFFYKYTSEKSHKYMGFIYGFMYAYVVLTLCYNIAFGWDFSYYKYLTPFNVLVLSLTLSVGYTEYNMSTKHKRIYIVYGIYLAFLLFILHGVVCNFLEQKFGWDLNFLYFPWQH